MSTPFPVADSAGADASADASGVLIGDGAAGVSNGSLVCGGNDGTVLSAEGGGDGDGDDDDDEDDDDSCGRARIWLHRVSTLARSDRSSPRRQSCWVTTDAAQRYSMAQQGKTERGAETVRAE